MSASGSASLDRNIPAPDATPASISAVADVKSVAVDTKSDEKFSPQKIVTECFKRRAVSLFESFENYRYAVDDRAANQAFGVLFDRCSEKQQALKDAKHPAEEKEYIATIRKSIANHEVPKKPAERYREKNILAIAYYFGIGVNTSCENAFNHFSLINKDFELEGLQGNAVACYMMGFCYQYGFGVKEDPSRAIKLISLAAALNYGPAHIFLAHNLERSSVGRVRGDAIVNHYEQAAECGDMKGMFRIGMAWWNGAGMPSEAVKWFKKAAMHGSVPALTILGTAYFVGKGVPQDLKAAVYFYRAKILTESIGYPIGSYLSDLLQSDALRRADPETQAYVWYHSAMVLGNQEYFNWAIHAAGPARVLTLFKEDISDAPQEFCNQTYQKMPQLLSRFKKPYLFSSAVDEMLDILAASQPSNADMKHGEYCWARLHSHPQNQPRPQTPPALVDNSRAVRSS